MIGQALVAVGINGAGLPIHVAIPLSVAIPVGYRGRVVGLQLQHTHGAAVLPGIMAPVALLRERVASIDPPYYTN